MNAPLTLTYKATNFFLDRAEIQKRIGRNRARALSRGGAFVRRKARTAVLRRRKSVSAPGSPPSVHSSDSTASLKNILFAYDPGSETVVVGPVGLGGGRGLVPSLLEFGGDARITEKATKGQDNWRPADRRRSIRPYEITRVRRARYRARPFMGPALRQTLPELPQSLRDLIG